MTALHPPGPASPPVTPSTLRLATRGSALARVQTELAARALAGAGAGPTEMVVLRTRGDVEAETPASRMTGDGWFTSELEAALVERRADAAVHSAKDLPSQLGQGLVLAAHLERADARDALVTRDGAGLDSLPAGARVATSSPRREAFLRALRPDLEVVPIRGNVDTRLRRLEEGRCDALVLACAGLDRLGLGGRIAERLDPRRFVPAPAQGAVALEALGGTDAARRCWLANHFPTSAAVVAERSVLVALGGGCRLPLGAWARLEEVDGAAGWLRLVLLAALATPDGVRTVELDGAPGDAEAVGARVAERLR
ncbi:MAG TPA: hydroxymethylbilane synthase [Candidatus Dormibacteraeota bacterium]|nr:hydroxymethylbilane synthase [Candidatus Dormibacteraeota bacterium]